MRTTTTRGRAFAAAAVFWSLVLFLPGIWKLLPIAAGVVVCIAAGLGGTQVQR
jgi:hypothetical protein